MIKAALYRRKRTFKQGVIGLVVSVLAATVGAIAANLTKQWADACSI